VTRHELGATTRARDLIGGHPDAVRTMASKLRSRADRVDVVGTCVRRMDLTGVWEGQAAASFARAAEELLPHVDFASEVDREAARSLDTYARILDDAQLNAGRAIDVWAHGEHLTAAAHREQTIALYGASTELVFDPGAAQRANAQRILELAREEVADAGDRAAAALHDSQHGRPIGFWDVVGVALDATVGTQLRDLGNGLASLANAMSQHPDELGSLLLGLVSMQGGMDGFVGGVALDATGAGAPVGVAANVASVGLVVGGATLAGASMSKLIQQAAGEDGVQPFAKKAAEPGESAGYSGSSYDEKLAEQFRGGPPKASDLETFAQGQGWTRHQSPTGPIKYVDENGIVRMKDAENNRVDPWGNDVTDRSAGNHTPISWDLAK
jgi:uncharacterized protein YukE